VYEGSPACRSFRLRWRIVTTIIVIAAPQSKRPGEGGMSAPTWMQVHGGRTDAYTNNDLPSLSKMAAGVSVVSTEGAGGGVSAAEDGRRDGD